MDRLSGRSDFGRATQIPGPPEAQEPRLHLGEDAVASLRCAEVATLGPPYVVPDRPTRPALILSRSRASVL